MTQVETRGEYGTVVRGTAVVHVGSADFDLLSGQLDLTTEHSQNLAISLMYATLQAEVINGTLDPNRVGWVADVGVVAPAEGAGA